NLSGSATITVTVNDGGGVNGQFSQSFVVTVDSVNDAPTLSAISSVTTHEDAGPSVVTLLGIGAGDDETDTLTVTALSSNTALVPNPTVTYTSPDASGTLSFTPVGGANGTATITVTVNDGQGVNNTAVQSFTVTVDPAYVDTNGLLQV